MKIVVDLEDFWDEVTGDRFANEIRDTVLFEVKKRIKKDPRFKVVVNKLVEDALGDKP